MHCQFFFLHSSVPSHASCRLSLLGTCCSTTQHLSIRTPSWKYKPDPEKSSCFTASPQATTHGAVKSKPSALQEDCGMEIDPWSLLEEGTELGSSSSNTLVIGGSDQAKASTWLMGAVRVRPGDLTYIGSVDEDS